MSYLVIARKYRPQTFDEVVGQEHIARTLKNAIEMKRMAHAYLFSGPRGVGKTTTARILAKALNCQIGPTSSPCNQCTACTEITDGRALDVIEIDGASNRGIDEVRELRENVKFTPSSLRYKIYIIDEVHMLTDPAFNALLKTLEEPPEHIVFMFATTEPHRIPLTIKSRCQRFNFKLIPRVQIIERLKHICQKENIKIDQDSLMLIARSGEGSMRDAESIMDQVVSYTGKEVKKEEVIFILGILPMELLNRATDMIIESRPKDILNLLDEINEGGYNIHQFINDLRQHFRNILILKTAGRESTTPSSL